MINEFLFKILFIKTIFVNPNYSVIKILYNSSIFFTLTAILFYGCEQSPSSNTHCPTAKGFDKVLLNNYWCSISKNEGVAITKDSLYIVFHKKYFLDNSEVMVHYLLDDGTFISRDFSLNDITQRVTIFGKQKNFIVYGSTLEKIKFQKLAIGQYVRKNDQIVKYWEKVILFDDLIKKRSIYRNEFVDVLDLNLLKIEIECELEKGICFKNSKGFSFLIGDNFLYILKPPKTKSKGNFMVHFIYGKNKFMNQSFNFDNSDIVYPLTIYGEKFNVAKISIPEIDFINVRIGEYNENGNFWIQFFSPKELKDNLLLSCKKNN
jgi:hypothetical protein